MKLLLAVAIATLMPTIINAQETDMRLNAPVKVTQLAFNEFAENENVTRGILISVGDTWIVIDQGEKGQKAIPVHTILEVWQAPESPEE